MRIRHTGQSRNGFTLVELLVAITVIGILMGMLSMAIFPALRRAKESAVIFELKQLEMSLEQFKTQYGFYPPSFETGPFTPNLAGANALLPFINRISPNHSENLSSGVSGRTRLQHWWMEVGRYLDQESSIVFWLSGVCKNKQYPLTGLADTSSWAPGSPPLAAHSFNFVNDGIERDVFYDFKAAQLVGNFDANGDLDTDDVVVKDKFLVKLPVDQRGFIVEYRQPHGGVDEDEIKSPGNEPAPNDPVYEKTDYRYKYREVASYDLGGGNRSYYGGSADGAPDAIAMGIVSPSRFANPGSFQIITFGMDGLAGSPGNWNAVKVGKQVIGSRAFFGGWGADNLCNFADGRLERWAFENE